MLPLDVFDRLCSANLECLLFLLISLVDYTPRLWSLMTLPICVFGRLCSATVLFSIYSSFSMTRQLQSFWKHLRCLIESVRLMLQWLLWNYIKVAVEITASNCSIRTQLPIQT